MEGASKEFVMKNAAFLLDTVLTLVEHKYQVVQGDSNLCLYPYPGLHYDNRRTQKNFSKISGTCTGKAVMY